MSGQFWGKQLSELVDIAEEGFNYQETPEDRQTRGMAKVLLAARSCGHPDERELKNLASRRGKGKPTPTEGKTCPPLERDQCAYCKEEGHRKIECPEKNQRFWN